MKWDVEVDVVCTGSGIAGLAHSVAVVDMDGEVFVASSRDDTHAGGVSAGLATTVVEHHTAVLSIRATVVGCHRVPRFGRCPSSLRASAIARRLRPSESPEIFMACHTSGSLSISAIRDDYVM